MTDTIKPRDISDDLVERVARELRSFYSEEPVAVCDGVAFKAARAAIALVLEEAAREAECVVAYGESQAVMRENIAAAIRALFQKETPNV